MDNIIEKFPNPNHSEITLYCDENSIYSHFIRLVLSEKDISYKSYYINDLAELPDEISEFNYTKSIPVLYDRGEVIYDLRIIAEYLDERYPFPTLMSVNPILRAQRRQLLYRFCYDDDSLYGLCNKIVTTKTEKDAKKAREKIRNYLVDLVPLFKGSDYYDSNEFSIIDACLAVLLWRLKYIKVVLPREAIVLAKYAKFIFDRKTFQASLSNYEKYYYSQKTPKN